MTSSNVRCEYGYGRVEGHCFRALSRAQHDQGNDQSAPFQMRRSQDDDEFAKAKHELADLGHALRNGHEALEFVGPVQDQNQFHGRGVGRFQRWRCNPSTRNGRVRLRTSQAETAIGG